MSIIWNLIGRIAFNTVYFHQTSPGGAAGVSSPELAAWWENFDLMVSSIKDPDALAEEACKLELVGREARDVFINSCFGTVENKCRSLLQSIEGKVKGQRLYFHQFLTALRCLPDLSQLAAVLQSSYGRLTGYVVDLSYPIVVI